jgi:hypothetical protein
LQLQFRERFETLYGFHAPHEMVEIRPRLREWAGREEALYAREGARFADPAEWPLGSGLRHTYYRTRLATLYSNLGPVNLPRVIKLVRRYNGREEALCTTVARKYDLVDSLVGSPAPGLPRDSDFASRSCEGGPNRGLAPGGPSGLGAVEANRDLDTGAGPANVGDGAPIPRRKRARISAASPPPGGEPPCDGEQREKDGDGPTRYADKSLAVCASAAETLDALRAAGLNDGDSDGTASEHDRDARECGLLPRPN